MENLFTETYLTEIGKLAIHATESNIVKIEYVENVHNSNNGSKLTDKAAFEINDFAHGKIKEFTLPFQLTGTDFEKKVWKALLAIPYGKTKSYSQIAEEIGSPQGARAVGNACNHNPLPILIPCHRAVNKDGSLGGYAAGSEKKKYLLMIEGNRIKADTCFCTE